MEYEVAVVGGGIAGYTAALALKNFSLPFLWLAEEVFSWKTRAAEHVRNFPLFSGVGEEFARALEAQRARENVPFTQARVNGIFKTGEKFLLAADGKEYSARAVILCTGVDLRGKLEGEEKFAGKGVSYCAVCDGALYRGKTVAAVLSSEKYSSDVSHLARFAKEIHVFCKGFSSSLPNVTVHAERPLSIEGEKRAERLVYEGGSLDTDGVFLLRDAVPLFSLCGGLACEGAHVKVDRDLSTNLKGLFAAGDVTGAPYQYVKAAGEGLVAAFSAREYLK